VLACIGVEQLRNTVGHRVLLGEVWRWIDEAPDLANALYFKLQRHAPLR
jgi:hypothetical protein